MDDKPTSRRTQQSNPPADGRFRDDGMKFVLEYLVRATGVDAAPAEFARAIQDATRDGGGQWDATWQDCFSDAARRCGLHVHPTWLSTAEVAGAVRPGQPAVTYRSSQENPAGWTVVVDRRWGRLFRTNSRHPSGGWVTPRELSRELDSPNDGRLPWLLCEPTIASGNVSAAHHGSHTPPTHRLRWLVRPDRSDLWSIVLFGGLVGALTLATPIAVQQLVNSVALGGLLQPVVVLALLLFTGLSFAAVLSGLQAFVAEIVQRRIFARVVGDLAYRLPRVRVDAFDHSHAPELVNRFFDVMTVQKLGSVLLLDGVALVLQTVIGLVLLSFYHPLMLAFSILLLAGIAVVAVVFGFGAVPTAIDESRAKYAVAGWLEEIARHSRDLRTPGAAEFALHRADTLTRSYLRARARHYRIVFRQLAGALTLQVLASSVLLGLGGGLVIAGQLTLGQLVASELIVTAIVASFAKLGKHLESYYDLLAAVDKIGHLFDLPLERADGALAPESAGGGAALHFHGVSFGFGDRPVLDQLAFAVAPGEKVALLGPSGSGKSTAFDLILGLRSPAAGYITFDGVDLRQLRLEALREQVARVGEPQILEATVDENVRMGRAYVTPDDVRNALAAFGVLDPILRLRLGVHTALSTDGYPLSRGQAARVDLARAIAGRPRLVLLDDTLGSLDRDTRRAALDVLFAPNTPWTLIVACDSEELAARCDRIVHLAPVTRREATALTETTDGAVTEVS